MNDETINAGRLKIAISLLDGRQTSRYSRLISTGKPTVLDRLNIATDLFGDKQTNEFAERAAAHEGFRMPPKACKGGDCCGCKTGQRTHCPYFKQVNAAVVNRLGLTVRHRRKTEGDQTCSNS